MDSTDFLSLKTVINKGNFCIEALHKSGENDAYLFMYILPKISTAFIVFLLASFGVIILKGCK